MNNPISVDFPRKQLIFDGTLQEKDVEGEVTVRRAFLKHLGALTGADLKVWMVIMLTVDEKGQSEVKIKEIAEHSNLSHQGVIESIRRMEGTYLTVDRYPRRNVYTPISQLRVNSVESTQLSQLEQINNKTINSKDINLSKVESTQLTHLAANPDWAMAMGVDYKPDPLLVALDAIRQRWESNMGYERWERWGKFDHWLLDKERQGQSIEVFADYFRKIGAMKFVGIYTPEGDKQGKNSYKALWPLAFLEANNGKPGTSGQAPASESDREIGARIRAEREARKRDE